MTKSTVVFTELAAGAEAGADLGMKIKKNFGEIKPDVVIVFASSVYNYTELLASINSSCEPRYLVGSSSAGEFTSQRFGTDSACALAIHSTDLIFSVGMATGISENREEVADKLCATLKGADNYYYQYHTAMLFADALSGYTDELIDLLTEKTMGKYQFFGGGAGDNANFNETFVFINEMAVTDAAVILEIQSNKPLGIGMGHGWRPISEKIRVTEADGRRLISLNARPALDFIREYADFTGQPFDESQPIPFFLHNIFGIAMEDGYKLRAPLAVNPDGSILLASDITAGTYINIMGTDNESSSEAAYMATSRAMQNLEGHKPNVALFFDCVATRLRMGKSFDFELDKVRETLSGVEFVGCNTYGQVARINGQFNGFQNCTAIVCVIPE